MPKITIAPAGRYAFLNRPAIVVPLEVVTEGNSTPPPDSDYGLWAAKLGVGGPLEDQDKDGLPNLLEFPFGGDPTQPDYVWSPVPPSYGAQFKNYVMNFQYFGSKVKGMECVIQVGSPGNWRPADPSDLLVCVDGLNLIPCTDALLKAVLNDEMTQMLVNKNEFNTPAGLIRPVVSYSW
jgi:hypothetical protein